jgi:hypothetical protein
MAPRSPDQEEADSPDAAPSLDPLIILAFIFDMVIKPFG